MASYDPFTPTLFNATNKNIVVEGIYEQRSKAEEQALAIAAVIEKMNNLMDSIGDVPQISAELGAVTATVGQYVSPVKPTRPTIDTTFDQPPALSPIVAQFPTASAPLPITPEFAAQPGRPSILYNAPAEPALSTASAQFPNDPAEAVLGNVAELVIDPVPVLTAAEPTIRSIAPPVAFNKAAPVADSLPERAYPDKPASTMPSAPTLRTLTLPTEPELMLFAFEGVMPGPLDAPPSVSFNWTEAEYQSILNDALKDKLLSWIQNTAQTGLNPAVEQQVWDRARERTASAAQAQIEQITRLWARSGWNMAQGDEAEAVFKAMEQQVEADITESRSIAVSQATLEQANVHFAFTNAISLEHELLVLHQSSQQRLFEAAKYTVQAAIDLYGVKVNYFNAGVTLYTAQAQVYRDRIQAELAKLELYKTQLEGQKLIGTLNEQDLTNYRTQIDAVVAVFGLYKSELEAVKTQLEGDGLKIQQFEANVRAFVAEYGAKALEYEGYKAELSGEEIKAKMYDSLVSAFGKQIDAFASVNNARSKKLDADVKINYEVPLQIAAQQTEIYKSKVTAVSEQLKAVNDLNDVAVRVFAELNKAEQSRVDAETKIYQTDGQVFAAVNQGEASKWDAINKANSVTADIHKIDVDAKASELKALTDANNSSTETYRATVQAKAAQIGALTDLYKADADVFGTEAQSEGTRINAQVAVQKQEVDYRVAQASITIEALKANVSAMLGKIELVLGTLSKEAQVQAQLVAGLTSSINYSAGLSSGESQSQSVGYSSSNSQSESWTHSD